MYVFASYSDKVTDFQLVTVKVLIYTVSLHATFLNIIFLFLFHCFINTSYGWCGRVQNGLGFILRICLKMLTARIVGRFCVVP